MSERRNRLLESSTWQKLQLFLYRVSLIFFITAFVAACSLLPVDTLIQSTKSTSSSGNLAVNAIIVISCCVVFIVMALVLAFYRSYKFYILLSDIPKRYIPIHSNDFTGVDYYDYIMENTKECQMTYHESNTPPTIIEHPGLSSPIKHDPYIPSSLVYEDVLRSIGDRVRVSASSRHANLSFREHLAFKETLRPEIQDKVSGMYERLRFSNKAIQQDQFLEFLVEFVEIY